MAMVTCVSGVLVVNLFGTASLYTDNLSYYQLSIERVTVVSVNGLPSSSGHLCSSYPKD